MSVESCTAFLEYARSNADIEELLRAMTDIDELVALGRRSGYSFEVEDIASSVRSVSDSAGSEPAPSRPADETTIYHYELDLLAMPEMRPVLDELPNLKIKPETVDLDEFSGSFSHDDMGWTEMSPAAPGFQARYEKIMASHWNGAAPGHRRDFHLINLDRHHDHELYESYLQAKVRTIRHLSALFGCDVHLSGSMWYPPYSYRLWHTNEDQPGWRMYLIDFDETVPESDTRSFFRYMNPNTKELVTLQDRPKMLRFFKIDQAEDRLFWHCIVNQAERNRWSFGFVIPDDWITRLHISLDDRP